MTKKQFIISCVVVMNLFQFLFNIHIKNELSEVKTITLLRNIHTEEERRKSKLLAFEVRNLRDEVALLYSNLAVRRIQQEQK